jgi:hypothetical protein
MTSAEKRAKRLEERRLARAEKTEAKRLALLDNDSYVDDLLADEIKEETNQKLTSLIENMEDIVASMPVYDSRTRENRKFKAMGEYGLGTEFSKITGLLSGIQYSAKAHKDQMLAETGLSEVLIESTLDALGRRSYYSQNNATIVTAVPANVGRLKTLINRVADKLGVELDDSYLNQASFDTLEERALLKAQKQEAEDQVALNLGLNTVNTEV